MQNSVLAMRKAVRAAILPLNPRVYYQRAPTKDANGNPPAFPYVVVFHQATAADGANTETIPVEIDVWDDNQDQTDMENLVQDIVNALDKKVVTDDAITMNFQYDSRIPILDPEDRVSRKKILIQCRSIQRR